MKTQEEGVLYSSKQYSQGVLTLANKVRAAIQANKPDAVLVGETTAGPIARHWNGGLSADFAWMAEINQQRILASPVRYGIPEVNFMSNGRTLNELNQVFAAGHNLALCDAQLPLASYITAGRNPAAIQGPAHLQRSGESAVHGKSGCGCLLLPGIDEPDDHRGQHISARKLRRQSHLGEWRRR
jgi:hypothetical protein